MTVPATGYPAGVATPDPFLIKYYGQSHSQPADAPLGTVTKKDTFALCIPEAWPYGLDINYRMLKISELKQAQGFPADYTLTPSTKGEQKKLIGNAVPVGLATSLVEHVLANDARSLDDYGGGVTPDSDVEVPSYQEVADD